LEEPLMENVILDYIKNEYLDEDDEEDMDLDKDTPLITSGIVDSFSMVSLKRFLETQYEITIPDEDATPEAFNTVSKIIELIQRLKKD
jgi:acyl carrier protein